MRAEMVGIYWMRKQVSTGEFTARETRETHAIQGRMTDLQDAADALNLTDFDKEPIHIPGYVQPHGVLLALTEPALTIVQASESTETVLQITASSLLQHSLAILLDVSQLETLWGLISCHNDSAKYVPYEVREVCEFLEQILSFVQGCYVPWFRPEELQTVTCAGDPNEVVRP